MGVHIACRDFTGMGVLVHACVWKCARRDTVHDNSMCMFGAAFLQSEASGNHIVHTVMLIAVLATVYRPSQAHAFSLPDRPFRCREKSLVLSLSAPV
jgi:hypothetical protein